MTQSSPATCASCGAAGSGRFCSSCGAPRGGTACAGCGSALPADSRFCPSCGRSSGVPGTAPSTDRTPWIIAGAALAGLLGVLLVMLSRSSPPAVLADAPPGAAAVADGGGESPPDISNMSPRERFDRLYNRVMRSAQSGDEAAVTRFTPMALMAYAQLDTLDADARYHAALLQVHTGDVAGPVALADTILKQVPGHLFGYMIRGTVARWRKDDQALARAYAGFLDHYDAEQKAGRVEYQEHKASVDEFHRAATQAGGPARPGT
jgi:hypothetical protein